MFIRLTRILIQILLLCSVALSIAGILSSHIIETVRVIFISNIILMGLIMLSNGTMLIVKAKNNKKVKVK